MLVGFSAFIVCYKPTNNTTLCTLGIPNPFGEKVKMQC